MEGGGEGTEGKLRCWYIMEIRRGQSGYYVFLVIYIRFLSTSSSGHLRHRRNTGSKACTVHREGRGGEEGNRRPFTALSSSNYPVLLSLDLDEYVRHVFSLSLSLSLEEMEGSKGLPRGRGDSPHFFELTTPLRRNFFSAFFTFFTPPSSRKRRFARKSLIIEEISVDSRATL